MYDEAMHDASLPLPMACVNSRESSPDYDMSSPEMLPSDPSSLSPPPYMPAMTCAETEFILSGLPAVETLQPSQAPAAFTTVDLAPPDSIWSAGSPMSPGASSTDDALSLYLACSPSESSVPCQLGLVKAVLNRDISSLRSELVCLVIG